MATNTPGVTVTDEEIEAALLGPTIPQCPWPDDAREGPRVHQSLWVKALAGGTAPALPRDELLEVAAESPDGTLATIHALLRGLAIRHEGDDATTSALVAIECLHLPNLLDAYAGR